MLCVLELHPKGLNFRGKKQLWTELAGQENNTRNIVRPYIKENVIFLFILQRILEDIFLLWRWNILIILDFQHSRIVQVLASARRMQLKFKL